MVFELVKYLRDIEADLVLLKYILNYHQLHVGRPASTKHCSFQTAIESCCLCVMYLLPVL